VDLRTFRLTDGPSVGRAVSALEKSFTPERVFVERIRRGDSLLEATPTPSCRPETSSPGRPPPGASGLRPDRQRGRGPELLDFPLAALDVNPHQPAFRGQAARGGR